MRGIAVKEDGHVQESGSLEMLAELENENNVLREKLANVEREKMSRTPSRKLKVLKTRAWTADELADENVYPLC